MPLSRDSKSRENGLYSCSKLHLCWCLLHTGLLWCLCFFGAQSGLLTVRIWLGIKKINHKTLRKHQKLTSSYLAISIMLIQNNKTYITAKIRIFLKYPLELFIWIMGHLQEECGNIKLSLPQQLPCVSVSEDHRTTTMHGMHRDKIQRQPNILRIWDCWNSHTNVFITFLRFNRWDIIANSPTLVTFFSHRIDHVLDYRLSHPS